jgi:tetratricopeptide (TPR) repeat protein
LSAQPSAPQTPLQRGVALYESGSVDEAARVLAQALPTLSSPRDRATAWLYRGLIHADRRDFATARRFFREALVEDPRVSPDRERVFPAVLELFAGVRQGVLGTLEVSASEKNARVVVDERSLGNAPMTARLPVGEHTVKVISADGDRASEPVRVLVTARAPATAALVLIARPGTLVLSVKPATATLSLDGKPVGAAARARLATSGLALPAGKHRVALAAPDHEPVVLEVRIIAGDTSRHAPVLRRLLPPWYKRPRLWSAVAAGVSAAALVTALLVGRSATANEDEIRRGERAGTLDQDRYDLLARSAKDNARIANVFLGVAGAAAVTGAVLFVLGREGSPAGAVRAGVRFLPSLTGASLEVRY